MKPLCKVKGFYNQTSWKASVPDCVFLRNQQTDFSVILRAVNTKETKKHGPPRRDRREEEATPNPKLVSSLEEGEESPLPN